MSDDEEYEYEEEEEEEEEQEDDEEYKCVPRLPTRPRKNRKHRQLKRRITRQTPNVVATNSSALRLPSIPSLHRSPRHRPNLTTHYCSYDSDEDGAAMVDGSGGGSGGGGGRGAAEDVGQEKGLQVWSGDADAPTCPVKSISRPAGRLYCLVHARSPLTSHVSVDCQPPHHHHAAPAPFTLAPLC